MMCKGVNNLFFSSKFTHRPQAQADEAHKETVLLHVYALAFQCWYAKGETSLLEKKTGERPLMANILDSG